MSPFGPTFISQLLPTFVEELSIISRVHELGLCPVFVANLRSPLPEESVVYNPTWGLSEESRAEHGPPEDVATVLEFHVCPSKDV